MGMLEESMEHTKTIDALVDSAAARIADLKEELARMTADRDIWKERWVEVWARESAGPNKGKGKSAINEVQSTIYEGEKGEVTWRVVSCQESDRICRGEGDS